MSRATRRRALAGGLALLAIAATTTGCGFHGLYSMNLPGSVGGPFTHDKTYDVTADFYTDENGQGGGVLDLVPQSSVRVNDVTVGTVEKISVVQRQLPTDLSSTPITVYAAEVKMKVKTSVVLPQNATAVLDETSLLGEKFIELERPATPDMTRTLQQTGRISPLGTSAYPGVEQVFGVLASVLNGGGLAKLQTINTELSAALIGREGKVHDVLVQLNTFVGGLNAVRTQISGAITSLDTLSTALNKQDATIATALDDLGPGIKVLADERAQLVSLLQGLSNLGVISNRVVNESLAATEKDLALLEPTLTQLNKAGAALPGALELIPDFPFARNSVNGIKGDGNNLVLDVNLESVLSDVGNVCKASTSIPAQLQPVCDAVGKLATQVGGVVGGLGLGDATRTSVESSSLDVLLKGGAQ